MDAEELARIAKGLTKAQRAVVLATEGVRQRREVHARTWAALFRKGLVSHILAGGYLFFDLTPLGLALRAHLLASEVQQ